MDNLSNDEAMNAFVNELIDEKKLEGLTPEVREGIAADLKERILDQIQRSIIAALPEDKFTELESAVDGDSLTEEQMSKIIEESNLNMDEIVGGTLAKFREIYLNGPAEVEVVNNGE